MKEKLIILATIVLAAGGGICKTVLAKPREKAPKPKVEGNVYVLPKEFRSNLADGRYAKLSVGLVLDIHDTSLASAGGHGGGATPPEGYGAMAQEALVRDLVTDAVNQRSRPPADRAERARAVEEEDPRGDSPEHGRFRGGGPVHGCHRAVSDEPDESG